jgi:ribosomal protein RSM22 (predicted rRNA methylase)
VQLPPDIRRAIEERAEEIGFATLKRASLAMSEAYRENRTVNLSDRERVAAYLVTRMPATYAATYSALKELPPLEVKTILDVGAGTGAASLAARSFFPHACFTLVERDRAFANAARLWLPDAEILSDDVKRIATFPPHDLIIAAYSIGEFGAAAGGRLWDSARAALLAIEPGTPRGFALIRELRDRWLAAGAHMAAPCPSAGPCPVVAPDWCHFAARVERSSLHRRVKGGDLGYEDEKFSYVAVTRDPVEPAPARIVRHPQHQPGLITLETCTPEGLKTQRILKRDREAFREARHAGWGDRWGSRV